MRHPILRLSAYASTVVAVAWAGLSVAQEPKGETSRPELVSQSSDTEQASADENNAREKRLISLGEALAASNQELGALREQHDQLKLQMEALGVAAIKGDERSLQKRMLRALADLRSTEKDRAELAEKLSRLAEAATAFSAKPGEESLKAGLSDALKAALSSKKSAVGDAVPLEAARVVSYKSELGLAVINAGRQSGVRMGAPLQIVRSDRSIATGLIVDVRDRISGLLITGDAAALVRAGDTVKPEITKSSNKQ